MPSRRTRRRLEMWEEARAPPTIAIRVLPTPPGPVRLTKRELSRSRRRAARSTSRPRNDVACRGRLFGVSSRARDAGNSKTQRRVHKLVDLLGGRHASQPDFTQIAQRSCRRQSIADQGSDGIRKEHLTRVGQCRDSCGTVDHRHQTDRRPGARPPQGAGRHALVAAPPSANSRTAPE